jgi:hypothetical protein
MAVAHPCGFTHSRDVSPHSSSRLTGSGAKGGFCCNCAVHRARTWSPMGPSRGAKNEKQVTFSSQPSLLLFPRFTHRLSSSQNRNAKQFKLHSPSQRRTILLKSSQPIFIFLSYPFLSLAFVFSSLAARCFLYRFSVAHGVRSARDRSRRACLAMDR